MTRDKIDLEQITSLSKELFHQYYSGELELWFSCLDKDSVYLGTGEPILFGKDVIIEHFKHCQGKISRIVQEEYFPIALDTSTAQVCGEIIVENPEGRTYQAITHFTMVYRNTGGCLKLIHQHNSYEYIRSQKNDIIKLDLNSTQFVRDLLLKQPSAKRMPVRSGTQTLFLNPLTIMYVQSLGKKTEIVGIDRVISCNSPLGQMARELPKVFYPLHRGYLVNTLYIVAIRCFEAELISGICLPNPALTYTQVKKDLLEAIGGKACAKRDIVHF